LVAGERDAGQRPSESDEGGEPLPVEAWLEGAREGAPESLGRALEACRPYLIGIATHELGPELRPKEGASDLVQRTFLEAARDFGSFNGRTGGEWRSWLRTIFHNNLRHLVRTYRATAKRMLSREVSLDQAKEAALGGPSLVDHVASPSAVAMKKERNQALESAVGRLSGRDRLLLRMRFEEQCTYEEMGRRLGCSPVAARKACCKAINRLRADVDPGSSVAG